MIRIGLVGLGQIATKRHLPSIAASADFTLAGLASLGGGAAVDGVPVHASHTAMLAEVPLDAVAICTPPAARFTVARDALLSGKHVLLEKPPAATLGEAEALAKLAAREGRVLFATWHSQYNPAVDEARRFLAGKKLAGFRVDWNEDFRKYHPDQEWIWREAGMGVFDMGINALSVLSRLFATPPFVRDAELRIAANHAAPISATLRFGSLDGGGAMEAHFDWSVTGPEQREVRLATQCGHTVELLDSGRQLVIDGTAQLHGPRAEYPALYARFADLLRGNRSDIDLVPLQMTLDALALGTRARIAAYTG